MEATNIKPMSGLRRFAIALLIVGGSMIVVSTFAAKIIGKMDEFVHGFTFGIALSLIIWAMVLIFKDLRNLRKQEKEQKKDKPAE